MRSLRTRIPSLARVWHGTAATALAACLALACGGGDDGAGQSAETPSESRIDIPMPEAEEPTTAEVTQGELPKDYPGDLPTFPGVETQSSMMIPGGVGMVVFTSDKSAEDVTAFYRKALPEQGWSVTERENNRIHASKDSRKATLTIEVTGGATQIAVVIQGA